MADLVEYCYGNASTAWGATRISNGHPYVGRKNRGQPHAATHHFLLSNPYPVRYIELGNEQYNYNYADQVRGFWWGSQHSFVYICQRSY